MMKMNSRVAKCIVFDIDDTLYLERDYIRSGFYAVSEWVREAFGISSFYDEALRIFKVGRRGDVFNVALEMLGVAPTRDLIQKLLLMYRAHDPMIRLLSDSEDCLREIAGRAFVGIISDGAVLGQQMKVMRLGLKSKCDHIILTESMGLKYCKPHPRAFQEMQRASGCPASACVYIADNPLKDFIAPIQLGWQTIRVRRPGGLHRRINCFEDSKPSMQISDLRRLAALILDC